jgi:hypothetical protein
MRFLSSNYLRRSSLAALAQLLSRGVARLTSADLNPTAENRPEITEAPAAQQQNGRWHNPKCDSDLLIG